MSVDSVENQGFDVSSTYRNRALTVPQNKTTAFSSLGLTTHSVKLSETVAPPTFTSFQLHGPNCSTNKFLEFAGTLGEVIVKLEANDSKQLECLWQISVPESYYMIVKIETVQVAFLNPTIVAAFQLPLKSNTVEHYYGRYLQLWPATLIPYSNVVYFKSALQTLEAKGRVKYRITFRATAENLAKKLHVVNTSPTRGYITPPGYDGRSGYAGLMDARYTVEVPEEYTVMISFEWFDFMGPSYNIIDMYQRCDSDYLKLFSSNDTGTEEQLWVHCGFNYIAPDVYNRSVTLHFRTDSRLYQSGFKMRFSLHRWTDAPRKLTTELFDCSARNYDSFKEHLHCNTYRECQGREDEGGHCPFSSPACNGSVAVGNKCYTLYFDYRTSWTDAARACSSRGANLATMKTPEEWNAFTGMFNFPGRMGVSYVGLTNHDESTPHYYKRMSRWIDNVINYNVHIRGSFAALSKFGRKTCAHYNVYYVYHPLLSYTACSFRYEDQYVCETLIDETRGEGTGPNRTSIFQGEEQSEERIVSPFVRCPSGHVTYELFACHRQSHCGTDRSKARCFFPPSVMTSEEQHMFTLTFLCATMEEYIPHTFVCDFKKDCVDASDEVFCVHGSHNCSGFTCDNGQCVSYQMMCDAYIDCEDGSDEQYCREKRLEFYPRHTRHNPPAIINFDGFGLVTQAAMSEYEPCPDTHFRCPGKLNYCMPVYVLCNGVYDCIGREDEAGCDSGVTCPGFYRCWDSAVCVHPDHICDGWPQCPRDDDELLCNLTCPHQCHCQGLAFLCREPFPARDFPDLRYLDASGSGMKLGDLAENTYLISALLKFCRLTSVSEVPLLNLRTLDLSENLLRVITMDVFLVMRNLKVLRLAGNPLVALIRGNSSAPSVDVESIDISRTQLETFDSAAFEMFNTVKQLNISFGRLKTVSDKGFRSLAQLSRLDLTGSPLADYPSDIFRGLTKLTLISTSNVRLCCRSNLPETFAETSVCISPYDELSSCEDLLRSNTYRLFLWMISFMSVIGNIGSLFFRCAVQKHVSKSGFNIFVTNLCLADLLMGVYLAMVGVADLLYRGQYLWYEKAWTSSQACRIAGVLSLLSSEVSAFIICLITLDRFIVLRFPFSTFRFRRASAVTASCLVWLAGK